MAGTVNAAQLKVGDAVWVATALLQQERAASSSFAVSEIVGRVKALGLTDREDISIYVHVNQHCVANRAPNPARLRMLIETPDGGRRLFRPGDPYDARRNGRVTPLPEDLSAQHRPLLDWYEGWLKEARQDQAEADPLLALEGAGRALWSEEPADRYIDRLRQEMR